MKTINWVLASLIATSSTVALAEEAPTTAVETQTEVTTSEQPAEKKVFNKLDADQDGKISQEEAKNYPKLVEGFDKIDADSDGFLSPEEFTRPHKKS
ncbi:hypothetical protein [Neptuniibacter marinus]|uniref:hypothetical protein n=1 Tax=Neptuniibacter marinus TaxID=1806670 RepID=UPI003B5BB238